MAKCPKDQSCGNCAYYIDDGCHFYPPPPVQTGTIGTIKAQFVWPKVQSTDWCGQWKRDGL